MIAIIPARSGSKGLPGKNIKDLNGFPLIYYTIKAALDSKVIDRIIVSTDCDNIANISRELGAEVPWLRPEELASDDAKAIDVYKHAINWLNQDVGHAIEDICILLPTCPLRKYTDIDKAVELFVSKNADSVVSYTKEHHPISWHKYLGKDLSIKNISEESLKNRQEEETSYFPNGSIYIFKTQLLFSEKYYSEKSYAYIMPRNRSVDIDYIDDFLYAEYLLKNGIK
ncbi:MAG: acylneuraminate cytidylyltransferase family protein [Bacteroidales bacterium]|nr:acylneuraminate cytidylyltransferase family protein [Bacteroidales bacterium]